MNNYMGVSKAYGRAIGTNFGFPSIAQSPPPEPELPLSQRRSGALAREGGKRAKLAKPALRTSGSSMLTANEHQDSLRSQQDFEDTYKRHPGELHEFQIDFQESPPHMDLQEAWKRMALGPKSWHTCSRKDQILEIRPHLDPVHIGPLRSLVLSGAGGVFVQSSRSPL